MRISKFNLFSIFESNKSDKNAKQRPRQLRVENLEERQLLAVGAAEVAEIKAAFEATLPFCVRYKRPACMR